jgi:hypothetical protein
MAKNKQREARHQTIGVVVDSVLEAVREAVRGAGGGTPALDRLTVLIRGCMGNDADPEGARILTLLPLIAKAVRECADPAAAQERPARQALVNEVIAVDDAEHGLDD